MKLRAKIPRLPRPGLTVTLILGWADHHLHKIGKYPNANAGPVLSPAAPLAINWRKIDNALRRGFFGLPGRNSLARVLEKHRGLRNRSNLPRLTDGTILAWADHHRDRTGKWPTENAGPTLGANGETWGNINAALRVGIRGLKGRRTLAQLIAKGRNVRNKTVVPKLSIRKILKMADTHHKVTGKWPKVSGGPIAGFQGETWLAVNSALAKGHRGLPGGNSLAEVLRVRRIKLDIASRKSMLKKKPADARASCN
jgi:hypothetical protein